jgi:hypothetical protein
MNVVDVNENRVLRHTGNYLLWRVVQIIITTHTFFSPENLNNLNSFSRFGYEASEQTDGHELL